MRSDPTLAERNETSPEYPSGWRLAGPALRYLFANLGYALRRKQYPCFRLRALATLPRKGMFFSVRVTKLGKHYFGPSLRTPRWPSPAFDRMVAGGGMNLDERWIGCKRHVDTAILAITRRCSYGCEHCYDARNRADTDVVPVERWIETIRQLQQVGVSVIVISGGEPMTRYDELLRILDGCDLELSDIHLHSSGAGVTPERAEELGRRGLVAAGIGLDFPDAERQNRFRGARDAFRNAVAALRAFGDAGVFTYANLCLTGELVANDGLYRYLEFARTLGVGAVQLLDPKPCGKYSGRTREELLSGADRHDVVEFFKVVNSDRRYAGHPPVAYTAYFERPEHFGCLMGGLAHLAIDGNGEVCPCVFVPVSFGNIMREEFATIYARMRSLHTRPLRCGCPAHMLDEPLAVIRDHRLSGAVPFNDLRARGGHMLTPKRT